jgi:hypothetical protein
VTVPWTVDDSLMEHIDRSAIKALQRDLACFDFPYVSKEERTTTEYDHGIIFVESRSCSSMIVVVPGAGLLQEVSFKASKKAAGSNSTHISMVFPHAGKESV